MSLLCTPYRSVAPGFAENPLRRGPSGYSRAMTDPGEEPDYRYTLANERTFLAWVRTSLALIAGGIALRAFAEQFSRAWIPTIAAVTATVLGGVIAILGYRQWRRIQIAMRLGQPLPRQTVAVVVTAGVVALAVVLTLGVIL